MPPVVAVLTPIHATVHTIFDSLLMAVTWSHASREKSASRSGYEREQECSCDPVSGH